MIGKALEPYGAQRIARFVVGDSLFVVRVADYVLERANRQIRLLREEKKLRALRQRDLALPVRPDSGERAKQRALSRAGRAPHQDLLALLQLECGRREQGRAVRNA